MIERIVRAQKRKEQGFTLIELLVVIIILGILAAVVVFAVGGVGDKGKSAALTQDVRTLRTAQEAFCAQRGHYATTQQELVTGGFISEPSSLNDIVPVGGPCGSGQAGPSGFDVRSTVVPLEVRHASGQTGYPSPFSYDRGPGYMQMHYLYDTLLWKDARGTPIPWLAAAMPTVTNGGTTYTFDLRPNVKWHDFATTGEILDANDVKFTFDYYKSAAAAGQLPPTVIAPPMSQITSVNVIDSDTVEFNLSTPAATFLQFGAAGAVPIAPQHIWSAIANPQSASGDTTKLIGTGPYKLEPRANTSQNFEYRANPDYFLGEPKVKTVRYVQQANALAALANGLVDVVGTSGPPSVIDPWKANSVFRVVKAPPGSQATQLNFNHAQAPFNNLTFRRAVTKAIDRQDLVNRLFGDAGGPGNGVPGNPGWMPPQHSYYEAAAEQYPFDVAGANALLDADFPRDPADQIPGEAAGVGWRHVGTTAGPRAEYTLTVAAASAMDTLLVEALKQIGVKLNPSAVGMAALNTAIANGTVGMYLIGSGGLNSDLGVDYLRLVYRSGASSLVQRALNFNSAAVPGLDTALDGQFSALDEATRKQFASDAQKLIADSVPLLPLVYPDSFTIFRRSVFDMFYYTPGGVAGVVPNVSNKHVFITGRATGGIPT